MSIDKIRSLFNFATTHCNGWVHVEEGNDGFVSLSAAPTDKGMVGKTLDVPLADVQDWPATVWLDDADQQSAYPVYLPLREALQQGSDGPINLNLAEKKKKRRRK